jgi:glycosyl transferase family 25
MYKSFIIHLSKIPSSLETALKVKEQLDSYGIENELFEGSYGHDTKKLFESTGRVCHPWGFKGPQSLHTSDDIKSLSTPGVMGCFYSHYRLWEKCVELNESIMIFEDDVLFTRPFIPVEWDEVLITVFGNLTKASKYIECLTNPNGEPKAREYWQASMPGTPGYAIKPLAAKKLLNFYHSTFLPADNAMMNGIAKIQVHSHIMGRALSKDDGKKSLVRGKNDFWGNFDK